ncbi:MULTISPECIES: MFS transporter [Burkholderia cepacia complex]|uniref:MFS transporter n=1 Tax=Burkholderia cepacia complex TaxID=87882 RepID=UPI0026E0A260|nr:MULTISPECIES: MFS transporter [Burkholderia cepacia complex]MDO5947739.1 MFS transporter [Burkholderia cepacia]MDS0803653.1 MFS transporter [Burkholderia cenocepacia]
MTRSQIMVIAICCVLNALDGIDILAISFASPGIAHEWAIDKAALGVVLSMELIGMAIGSVLFGHIADRRGRKLVVLSCLTITTLGMWSATVASSVLMLSLIRFATGLGIGSMITTAHALASEFASSKARNIAIACVGLGWPIGAMIGGWIAAAFITQDNWRHVFVAGAVLCTVFIPVVWFRLPESVSFVLERQPARALERANRIIVSLGHPPIERLSDLHSLEKAEKDAMHRTAYGLTTALAMSYFFDCLTYYFLLKWSPKIVADLGFSSSAAASVLVWGTVGQLIAILAMGIVATRVNPRTLALPIIVLTAFGVAAFGYVGSSLTLLTAVMVVATFCNQATNTLLIIIFIESFPASIRAGRLGIVMGVGRGGAALSPIIAGALLNQGYPLWVTTTALGMPVLVAGAVVLGLRMKSTLKPVQRTA